MLVFGLIPSDSSRQIGPRTVGPRGPVVQGPTSALKKWQNDLDGFDGLDDLDGYLDTCFGLPWSTLI